MTLVGTFLPPPSPLRTNTPASHKHSNVWSFLNSIVGGLGSLRVAFTTILLCACRISAAIVVEPLLMSFVHLINLIMITGLGFQLMCFSDYSNFHGSPTQPVLKPTRTLLEPIRFHWVSTGFSVLSIGVTSLKSVFKPKALLNAGGNFNRVKFASRGTYRQLVCLIELVSQNSQQFRLGAQVLSSLVGFTSTCVRQSKTHT